MFGKPWFRIESVDMHYEHRDTSGGIFPEPRFAVRIFRPGYLEGELVYLGLRDGCSVPLTPEGDPQIERSSA